jgi:dimethylargininase
MMEPKRAIVREPGENYTECISSHPQRRTIDVGKARDQHAVYCRTLADLGLEIVRLPRDDHHPDSCFVEDNAVVHGGRALICRMAKESRRGEESDVEKVLAEHVDVRRAKPPATVEGGDVIHIGNGLISGVTQRTNMAGVEQMKAWMGVEVGFIRDPSIVHLKSYVNSLGDGYFISTARFADHPLMKARRVITVRDEDWYSTNNIVVGDHVVMPSGFPRTEGLIRDAGFRIIPLEMTEFPKCEGALTCLSIIF